MSQEGFRRYLLEPSCQRSLYTLDRLRIHLSQRRLEPMGPWVWPWGLEYEIFQCILGNRKAIQLRMDEP